MPSGAATREQTSETARHIARVAARLFSERGYIGTSVRAIVEAAGVSRPTLYYYFATKETLAEALLHVPLAELVAAVRHMVTTIEDPIECAEQVVNAHYAFCRGDPDRGRFMHAVLFGPARSEFAGVLDEFWADLFGWTDAAVRRLAEAGIVARERLDACTTAYRGLIVVSTLDYLYQDKPLLPGQAGRQVRDLLLGFGEPAWRNNYMQARESEMSVSADACRWSGVSSEARPDGHSKHQAGASPR